MAIATLQSDAKRQIKEGVEKLGVVFEGTGSNVKTIGGDVRGLSMAVSSVRDKVLDILSSLDDSKASITNLSNNVDHIGRAIDRVERAGADFQADSNYKSVIDWLQPIDFTLYHEVSKTVREPDTGNWFLKGYQYENWKSTPESLFWLNGKRM